MAVLLLELALLIACVGCSGSSPPPRADNEPPPTREIPAFQTLREAMVREQIEARGIKDPRVLAAMRRVERHLFVPQEEMARAYDDGPLPIGYGQTISQPLVVAYMTEKVHLRSGDRVLEVGTGSGYQAAILSLLAKEVFTVEIVAPLAREAEDRLKRLGFRNVTGRVGDGWQGWPEQAPFDVVVVTAAPAQIPPELVRQLAPNGRMIVPVGETGQTQELILVTKDSSGRVEETALLPVRFVPMIHGGKPFPAKP